MHGRWDLRCDVAIRERTDQTHDGIRRASRDDGQVGILGFVDVGQAVQAPAELDDLTAFRQGIERVGVHAAGDEIAGTQRAAFVAEDSERALRRRSLALRVRSKMQVRMVYCKTHYS